MSPWESWRNGRVIIYGSSTLSLASLSVLDSRRADSFLVVFSFSSLPISLLFVLFSITEREEEKKREETERIRERQGKRGECWGGGCWGWKESAPEAVHNPNRITTHRINVEFYSNFAYAVQFVCFVCITPYFSRLSWFRQSIHTKKKTCRMSRIRNGSTLVSFLISG